MSHETKVHAHAPNSDSKSGAGVYIILTLTAAVTAVLAAQTSLFLTLPPWAMFMGWVAYFTRRPSVQEGFQSWMCMIVGITLGAAATIATGLLTPTLAGLAFPAAVLCVAVTVISTRGLPFLNNLLGYFLGLITFFAAHLEPELATIAKLGGATAIGSTAGWIAQTLEKMVRKTMAA